MGAIPPSMLQFPFSLVPSDWGGTAGGGTAGGIYHDPQYFLCAICYVYMIVSENQTSGTVHCNCFQNNVEVT